MLRSRIEWSLNHIVRMIEKGRLSLNHPIQRPSGQWTDEKRSLFIHTLVVDWSVPFIYVVIEKEKIYVIDGKQRFSTIDDFMNDRFSLTEKTPSVNIFGKVYKLAGKRYSALDQEVKDELASRTLPVEKYENASFDEIRESFKRLNYGEPLSKEQMSRAMLNLNQISEIDKLLNHPLIQSYAYFTNLQKKHSEDLAALLETTMLFLPGYKIKDFSRDSILGFSESLKEMNVQTTFDEIQTTFDYLLKAFQSKDRFLLRKINFPIVCYVAHLALEKKVSSEKFYQWTEQFKIDNEQKNIPYSNYLGSGSVRKEKILKRIEIMKAHFLKYVKNH